MNPFRRLRGPDFYELAALVFCNDLRALYDLDPLPAMKPGRMVNALHCSITETVRYGSKLKILTGPYSVRVGTWMTRHEMPVPVQMFMMRFDDKKYKHLVIK